MKKKNCFMIIALLILLITGCLVVFNKKKEVSEDVKSIVSLQIEKEKEFSTSGYNIDNLNVIVNPYGISPLTALIMFETEDEVEPSVTIKGKDKQSTFTNTFEKGTKHYLSIYGLYPDSINKVTISYGDIKKEVEIKTDKLPDNFVLPTKVKADKSKLDNELYFYTPSSIGYTCAYDVNGDVRWYLSNYALWEINFLDNNRLMVSTERLVNPPYYMSGLYEMDLLGKIYTEYSIEGGYHHDYFELPNHNLLVASDNFNNEYGTVEDYIVELDRTTGNIVKKFDLKDVIKMDDGKSASWSEYDWFHNNSVWYDEPTNSITLSGRHKDAVINIDYTTGKLNWIIGDPTNWDSEYQKYFFKPIGDDFEWQWSQHAAMITPEGYVFIFDNGNNKSKIEEDYVSAKNSYSRGVMYKIDTDKMTIEQIYEYGKERGSSFYSPYISDVDYLAESHYIIHSGGISYKNNEVLNEPAGLAGADKLVSDTVEVLNDKVIFELTLPTNNYRVEKLALYKGYNYTLCGQKRLGTLGKTNVDEKKIELITSSKQIDSDYESRNIKITKEEDRLVVNGQFLRGSKVNVILKKGFSSKYYNVSISKKPYTALCVDVFSEEENENGLVVNKYINKDGLSGIYKVYIQINDVIYDVNMNVEF